MTNTSMIFFSFFYINLPHPFLLNIQKIPILVSNNHDWVIFPKQFEVIVYFRNYSLLKDIKEYIWPLKVVKSTWNVFYHVQFLVFRREKYLTAVPKMKNYPLSYQLLPFDSECCLKRWVKGHEHSNSRLWLFNLTLLNFFKKLILKVFFLRLFTLDNKLLNSLLELTC